MEKINNINYDNYVWIEEMGFADAENEWERTFLAVVLARHHPLHGCEMYNCPNLRKELVGAIKQQVDQKGKLISTNGLREALEDRIKVYCEIWLSTHSDMKYDFLPWNSCESKGETHKFSPIDFFNHKRSLKCLKCKK
jgi:hypothetical protein